MERETRRTIKFKYQFSLSPNWWLQVPPIRRTIKKIVKIAEATLFLSPVVISDYLLAMKVKLTKENHIGVYVGICNKSERKILFPNTIAGGYCGYSSIKIFTEPSRINNVEDCALQILNHEVLHQVIGETGGHEARDKLDNVHKPFYVLDCQINKMRYVVSFCLYRKGHLFLVVPED
jgi:hypothetical protein